MPDVDMDGYHDETSGRRDEDGSGASGERACGVLEIAHYERDFRETPGPEQTGTHGSKGPDKSQSRFTLATSTIKLTYRTILVCKSERTRIPTLAAHSA